MNLVRWEIIDKLYTCTLTLYLCVTKQERESWFYGLGAQSTMLPICQWRCFWIQCIVIQTCEHGRWEFGGEGGSLECAQEMFISTSFNAWHGGGTHDWWDIFTFFWKSEVHLVPPCIDNGFEPLHKLEWWVRIGLSLLTKGAGVN